MTQAQFDQLLAWTMLGALKSAVTERQNSFGRGLTEEEHEECYKDTYKAADLIRLEMAKNREKRGK